MELYYSFARNALANAHSDIKNHRCVDICVELLYFNKQYSYPPDKYQKVTGSESVQVHVSTVLEQGHFFSGILASHVTDPANSTIHDDENHVWCREFATWP